MVTIVNNFDFPVIQEDDRNANVSWQHHLARGSSGGVDLAYPFNSPIRANAAGTVSNVGWLGNGGRTLNLNLGDGRYIQYMHLSGYAKSDGATVAIGDVIAYSGGSGVYPDEHYYDAHLHVHMYLANGTRVNLYNYFGSTTPTPPAPTDYTTDKEPQDMYIRRIATGEIAIFGADFRASTGGTAGRHIFASETEYNAWRSIVTTYNSNIDSTGGDSRGKRANPPAALVNVMGVDENGWNVVCKMFGV